MNPYNVKHWFVLVENGRVYGGMSNPHLYKRDQAYSEANNAKLQGRKVKVRKMVVTYRLLPE